VDNLTRYERYLLKQGLAKYERAKTLDKAMCIVLNEKDERDLMDERIDKLAEVTSGALNAGMNGTTVAMWNGQSPLQNAVALHNVVVGGSRADPRAIYQSANTYK
jgi:hypothetical protein